MPKVSSDTTDTPKRAPRKRAVRRVVTNGEAPVRRARSTATVNRESANTTISRKAPTRVVSSERIKSSSKGTWVVVGVIVLVLGTAAWIGFSDAGQIDVDARISERNEKIKEDAAAQQNTQTEQNSSESMVIPVQNTPPEVPASILRGRGVGTPPVSSPEPAPIPEETSTTTENSETEVDAEEVVGESSIVDNEVTEEGLGPESETPQLSQ